MLWSIYIKKCTIYVEYHCNYSLKASIFSLNKFLQKKKFLQFWFNFLRAKKTTNFLLKIFFSSLIKLKEFFVSECNELAISYQWNHFRLRRSFARLWAPLCDNNQTSHWSRAHEGLALEDNGCKRCTVREDHPQRVWHRKRPCPIR